MEYEAGQEMLAQASEVSGRDGDGIRLAQSRFLDELPALAFGLITLIWIVASFAGLEWRLETGAMVVRAHQLMNLVISPPHSVTLVSRAATAAGFMKRLYQFVIRRAAG
jgi:hypothetical protein